MSHLKIIIADTNESPAWKAWRQVLPLYLNGLVKEQDVLHCGEAIQKSKGKDECRIGLALTFEPDARDFWNRFVELERASCEFFIHVTWQTEDKHSKPWVELEPRWRGVCGQRSNSVTPNAVLLSQEIQERFKAVNKDFALNLRPCRPVADAKELIKLLPEFSHGGATDVTNIMLGPARMLILKKPEDTDRKDAWESWIMSSAKARKDACKKLGDARKEINDENPNAEKPPKRRPHKRLDPRSPFYNELAAQLFESWGRLAEWLCITPDLQTDGLKDKVQELERMMSLLTDIRSIAKGEPGASTSTINLLEEPAPDEIGVPKCDTVYRILVVDDHASCWSSTIVLGAKLAAETIAAKKLGKPVKIEIDYSTDAKSIIGRGDLDNFILRYDLVLQDVYLPGTRGIELIERLRKRVRWLPVIVWTSSLSSELAASATLHNGYLFKKTSTIQDLASVFEEWLPVGNARRHYSLLNPLFDHTIVTPALRKVAVDYTLWCLKLLDGFHAVDDSYFRFFNDHGGRHIVALLEKIEQLLRPLLLRGQLNQNGDAKSAIQFDEEELLGLYIAVLCHEFGMFPLGAEGFGERTHSGLELARKQHALTSFLALVDPDDPNTKLDPELLALVHKLMEISPKSHSLAAIISAYHSRVLSLDKKTFAQLKRDSSGVKKIRQYKLDLAKVRRLLTRTARTLRLPDRRAARHLSTIFRFADAIEMDSSRVPAPFLLQADGRADMQNREDLKRQVVSAVVIEDGVVNIRFNCPLPIAVKNVPWPWPSVKPIKEWSLACGMLVTDVFQFLREQFNIPRNSKDVEVVGQIKDALDGWLDNAQEGRCGKSLSLIAALSVICDVVDEFDAIDNVGRDLTQFIRLGGTEWGNDETLTKISLLQVVINRQERLLKAHQKDVPHKDEPKQLYEFKFVFQSRHFARALLRLIGRMGRFGDYTVERLERRAIKDVYYDEWIDAEGRFALTSKGISCRWRTIDKKSSFEIKRPIVKGQDYLKFATSGKLTKPCEAQKRPRQVPRNVALKLSESCGKKFEPIAVIENERCTLEVVGNGLGKWAQLHLDIFRVDMFRVDDSQGEPLEVCEEIEIVSPDDTVVADLSEILAASFKLFKTQRSRIERCSQALRMSPHSRPPEVLWLDVDTGVDDAMGLLLALRSPKRCKVVGVSAVGGNVSLEQVLTNSAKIVAYSGVFPKPPLFKGFAPLGARPDASNVHGKQGIGNIDEFIPDFKMPEWGDLAAGFDRVVAQHERGDITFVATGPLTNLAKLTQICPEAVKQLKAIVIMGGAFDEPGNRAAKAEFNIHSDPESARVVLAFCQQHDIEHNFIPLDITHRAVLQRSMVNDLCRSGNHYAKFIQALTAHYMEFYNRNQAMDGCPLHDPMAVGYVLWPEFFTSDTYYVEIAPSGLGAFSGATSADFRPTRLFRDRGNEVTGVVLRVDRDRFLQVVKDKLLKG